MNPLTTSAFDLPDRLSAKADPKLIATDEQHFAAFAESLEQSIADLSDRLDAERKAPGGIGQDGCGLPHRPGNVGAGVEHRIPAASPQQVKLAVPVPVQVLNAGQISRFGHRAVEHSHVMALTHRQLHEGTPRKPGAANHKKLHPNPRSP